MPTLLQTLHDTSALPEGDCRRSWGRLGVCVVAPVLAAHLLPRSWKDPNRRVSGKRSKSYEATNGDTAGGDSYSIGGSRRTCGNRFTGLAAPVVWGSSESFRQRSDVGRIEIVASAQFLLDRVRNLTKCALKRFR